MNMKRWNKGLRWVHLAFGLSISAYFFLLPADGYSDAVNNVYKFGVVAVVFWTGIIKWQLPRIARWRSRDKIKQARASS
jgi:hypothetical protein